jgi:type I restriction enzyme S subunit
VLDELLARSRRAKEELAAIPALLERYRQSVLAAAFRGDLTADWESFEGVRKGGLHADWAVFALGELAADVPYASAIGPFGSDLKAQDYRSDGVPLVFVRNIRSRRFVDAKSQYVSGDKANELSAHSVTGGDLLVTKMGEPPGDTAVYPRDLPDAVITADCIKLTPGALTSAEFLSYWLITPVIRARLLEEVRGVAQQKISLGRFRSLRVELPPLPEQHEIVRRIDAAFARIDAVRESVAVKLASIEALERAILTRAFRGELVPQDPADEPASVLLDRIRAERAAAPVKKRSGRQPRREA